MSDVHDLTIAFDVDGAAQMVQAERQHSGIAAVIRDVTDFLEQFGTPDAGPQQITITLRSRRAP
ncbi:MAG TPA: hypothetical protein VK741_25710 [Acetobacteraceae bacterium]|nr:hypothetical protein [Acetobacteraceae bacterium]